MVDLCVDECGPRTNISGATSKLQHARDILNGAWGHSRTGQPGSHGGSIALAAQFLQLFAEAGTHAPLTRRVAVADHYKCVLPPVEDACVRLEQVLSAGERRGEDIVLLTRGEDEHAIARLDRRS